MSLLWVEAAWAEWYDTHPDDPGWGIFGHGHETPNERDRRYIHQIAKVHRVHPAYAQQAFHIVRGALARGRETMRPTDLGFKSEPEPDDDNRAPRIFSEHQVWGDAPIKTVSTGRLHATQHKLATDVLAHNLFHPRRELGGNFIGHPEIKPNPDSQRRPQYVDPRLADVPTDLPRLIRQTDGSHLVYDGHHRLAAGWLLGKQRTSARVIDIRQIRGS